MALSQAFVAARGPGDAPCRLAVVPGADHFAVIDPGHGAAYRAVLDAVGELHPGAAS